MTRNGRRPERILMTTDTVGGVWSYSLELARQLTAAGIRVHLAALGGLPSDDQRAAVEAIDGVDFEARDYRLVWMEDPWDDVREACSWLSHLAREIAPDLVHLNTLEHGDVDWRAPVLTVGHSCVFSWFEQVRGEKPGPRWNRYRESVRASLRRSDIVVAPTRAMLGWLARYYGPLPRAHAILNGIDPADFAPGEKDDLVLCAGRLWDEAKNVAALAEAAADITWPVYVAGSSEHPDGGRIALEGIELLGRLSSPALARWYGRSRIYAIPARYEPFGLTPLEAALCGNALVLGDIPTLREVWGDAATFVDPERPDAIAEAINALIAQPERLEERARAARARAHTLTADRMGRSYLELYEWMISPDSWKFPPAPEQEAPCA